MYYFYLIILFIFFNCMQAMEQKPIIIFDLINVVIKENQSEFTKHIGYGTLASYTLTHWRNPGHRCLDMLETMSKQEKQKPHCRITLHDRVMPRCLVELQEGKKNCNQVKKEILQSIEELSMQKFFSSAKEKNLMTSIMELVLNPTVAENVIEPIKSTIQLIKQLKSNGYSVYLFANAPHELYTALQKKHASIIQLFDGTLFSCHTHMVKPNRSMFEHLIAHHNLNPKQCILIDDLPETAIVAKEFGMMPIIYRKHHQMKKELKKLGIRL